MVPLDFTCDFIYIWETMCGWQLSLISAFHCRVQELTDSLQFAFRFRTVFEPADMAIEVVLELLLRWKPDLEAY